MTIRKTPFCLVFALAYLVYPGWMNVAFAEPIPVLPATPYDYSVVLPSHLQDKNTSVPTDVPGLNNLATLGRVLFYDQNLSANNLVSCASCHKQASGFDDPARFSIGFKGRITPRSAMGLTNARFNANGRYFWDERALSLRAQVLQPFFDPVEMGLKPGGLVKSVAANQYYITLFNNAFGTPEISETKIASALAGFVGSIVSVNSLYDNGRKAVSQPLELFANFTDQQNLGKNLFLSSPENGGAGCVTCHQYESFISPAGGANNGLDRNSFKDEGIAEITGREKDKGKFRPPSLRNIAVRAPFMHDGRFSSLEAVINHYSTGIQNHANLGEALVDATGAPRKFDFSNEEKAALKAFLETLNDEKLLSDPKFSNPFQ